MIPEDICIEKDFESKGWKMEDAILDMKHMIGMYPEGCRRTYKRYEPRSISPIGITGPEKTSIWNTFLMSGCVRNG